LTPLEPSDPRVVAGYRLVGRIAAGGMGQVFLAVSPSGTPAAVKVILPSLAEQPEFRARFRREVRAARDVHSPYVAEVLDADPDGEQPWLATEYVAGPPLSTVVRSFGPLPPDSVTALAGGIVAALRAVEGAGVVHRDLKPSNVLLDADGPRVIDFGIAKATDASTLTQSGYVIGTPGYIAPEQILAGTLSPAADVFSLGGVLTFALTGDGPFGTGTPHVLMGRVLYAQPDLDAVPADWRDLLGRCLAKDPAERPTLTALADRFTPAERPAGDGWLPPPVLAAVRERAAAARRDVAAVVPDDADTRRTASPSPGRRRRWLLAAAAVLVVAVAVAVTVRELDDPGTGVSADPSASPATGTAAALGSAPPTSAASPSAATAVRSTVPPARNAIPADLLGTWVGDLHQEDIDRTYPTAVSLTGGRVGAVVGTVDYPAPGCSGELRLTAVTGAEIGVTEKITKGSEDCLNPIPLRLSAQAGALRYRAVTDGGDNPPVTGTLSRAVGQLPAALVGTWRGTVHRTGDGGDHEVIVTVTGRSLGAAGTIEYPAEDCRATLTADRATAGAGWFSESAAACAGGLVSLAVTGAFRWLDPEKVDGSAATGTLSRR
jgi:eukaryotic-like serine/threonine-protein kinase